MNPSTQTLPSGAPATVADHRKRIALFGSTGSIGTQALEVIAANPDRFEIVGLSFGPDDGTQMRRRMEAAFDRFVDLKGQSSGDIARRINALGIDILVDLNGYIANARPEILAARAAPIQCHFLAFPGTLGTDVVDYMIVDPVIVPAGVNDRNDYALEAVEKYGWLRGAWLAVRRVARCHPWHPGGPDRERGEALRSRQRRRGLAAWRFDGVTHGSASDQDGGDPVGREQAGLNQARKPFADLGVVEIDAIGGVHVIQPELQRGIALLEAARSAEGDGGALFGREQITIGLQRMRQRFEQAFAAF